MSNLYHFEMLFLIRIDELKNADKKTVKKMNKRIIKFKEKAKSTLEACAVPISAQLPIPLTQMVGYHESPFQTSNIVAEHQELYEQCFNENISPFFITNRSMACSYKSFPERIENKIEKINSKISKYASKLKLDGEYYAKLYETEREFKGIIQGQKSTGIRVLQSYKGSLR